eukprot:jgi/Chlat1/7722/Chrsp66S07193
MAPAWMQSMARMLQKNPMCLSCFARNRELVEESQNTVNPMVRERLIMMMIFNLQLDGHFASRVCVQVLSYFEGRQLHVLLDGTLGAAGHASALINAHPEMHTFIGLDVDPVAHELATQKLKAAAAGRQLSVHLVRTNFRHLKQTLAKLPPTIAANGVDGILLDLGMSSMQVNTADRGFSFSKDGPVDMRMDPTAGLSAADIVNTWPESELGELIRDYGEDRQWRRLARKLIEARIEAPITTTAQLAAALGPLFYPKSKGKRGSKPIHPATRVFQALRIVVNDELGAIRQVLPHAIECLAPGGRLGVISFHSLEDRIVKRAFRLAAGMHSNDDHSDFNLHSLYGMPASMKPPAEAVVKILTKRPLVADDDEIAANPRSRSAKLRVVEKL